MCRAVSDERLTTPTGEPRFDEMARYSGGTTLAAERHDLASMLVQRFAELQLQQELKDMFEASPIPEQRAANLKRLDEITRRRRKEPAAVHRALAILVIDTFPPARVRKMVKQAVITPAVATLPQA